MEFVSRLGYVRAFEPMLRHQNVPWLVIDLQSVLTNVKYKCTAKMSIRVPMQTLKNLINWDQV